MRQGGFQGIGATLRGLMRFVVAVVLLVAGTLQARWMLVGCDEKTTWDGTGRQLFFPEVEKDAVCVVDVASDPASPQIVATLPLATSVYGPPTNLAITPGEPLHGHGFSRLKRAQGCGDG